VNAKGKLIPYGRKSSGEDDELSRARQEGAIRRWADANGIELAPMVWEAHVSGSKRWRERGLGEALGRVERGEAAGIIVEEQSRLSREDMLATAEVWDAFQRADARLVCAAEGIDTATGDHELSFALRAALAREQWKQYARRMDDVRRNRTERGILIARTPLGYRKNDAKRLEIDPETAQAVSAAFEARAAGSSWDEVATRLDAVTGRKWSRTGARKLIANRVYLGEIVNGDLVTTDAHEAIIDAPLWLAAQREGKPAARSGPKSDRWLLAGLVRCGRCGNAMSVWHGSTKADGTRRRRYRCGTRGCSRPIVGANAPALEQWVVETLWLLLGSKVAGDEPASVDLAPLEEEVERTARRVEQVQTPEAMDALGSDWAANAKARRLEYEAALTALGNARQDAGTAEAAPEVVELRAQWPGMTTTDQREALSRYLVDAVLVNGPKPEQWELVLR
jgi:DNA invertase Pin-like site-specific DNA recombinase